MTLCLYECLRAIGLQRHYARFTSMGVRRAAHLSALTMEDYPILGIHTMEDRTRLFRLVQLVKTLDLESLGFEDGDDDDYDADGGDEDNTAADSSFTYDGYEDRDDDAYEDEDVKGAAVRKLNAATFPKPSSVRRRLDFSSESIDHHQKLVPRPAGTVHVSAGYNRNDESVQGRRSAFIPVQLELDSASAVVCACQGRYNNHRPDVRSRPSDDHAGENTKPDVTGGISIHSSHTRLIPKCESFHKPKPRPATVASKRFNNKPVGQKDRKGISRRQKLSTEIGINGASEGMAKPTPVYESKRTAGYNYGLPLSPPSASNRKQAGAQRISVCVRKRPLTRAESRRGEADVVTTPGGECVIVHESKEAVDLTQYILQHRFYFDQVFGEESSNEEVYQRTAYPLVQHMLNGGKATCFAYGQTGAGKTHTMLGSSPGRPGLYALAVQDIFAHLSTTHTPSPLLVYVSFFEIYCGQLYDLLDQRKRLFAREDGQKVVHIAGLRDVRVDSVSSLLEVITEGTEERTQGMSGVNPLSSRSHALLQIQLRGPNQQITGRMWFVDLAGSERASDTKEPDRQSRMEGAEINQSLLALKECIRSLDQEQSHTPFRQSKLTQVLKDSFVGDSMTCMIANISPGHLATEHTLNTLRYADRVKELRGQGGLRGGRRGKTIPSPKRNLSNSNSNSSSGASSVGTRGKSPPKKPKLGRQREAFSPTSPATILCSTPKNSRWGEETSARARQRIGLEQITPVRGSLGTGDKRRERTGEREDRRRASEERYGRTDNYSVGDQNTGAGLVLGQPTNRQHRSWEVQRERLAQEGHLSFAQRESGFYHRGKENQQITLKGGREEERRWREQRRQVESNRDTHVEVKRTRERDFQKAAERDKEKERRLRQYHQQLQQFLPSSASSSVHVLSPSTSLSSSNQPSLSSLVPASSSSSLGNSSHLSISALTHRGLEEVLHTYRARVEVRADGNRGQLPFPCGGGETCLQTEISPSYNRTNDEDGHGDSSGIGEDWRECWEGTEARFGRDRGKSEKRRSLEATGKGEVRVRREDRRSAGMERGEMKWAWVTTTETEQAGRMAGAMATDAQEVVSYNCDSEERREVGQERMDAPVWSTEEGDGYSLVSAHSTNENSFFNQFPVESPHQRAPAERPLSPACEHTNAHTLTPNKYSLVSKHTRCTTNIMPLPLQNAQQGEPSSSSREKEPRITANASRKQFPDAQSAKLLLTTSITENGCKIPAEPLKLSENLAGTQICSHPETKAKMSVLPKEESSLSDIMDPLSISLLEVDQQAATASFLQGEQSSNSLCPLENEREGNNREVQKDRLTCAEMEGKVLKDMDVEFRLSLLELPQAKIHCPPTSDTMTATNHTKLRNDRCCATHGHCGIGMVEPPIPEVMLVSLQDQENSQKPQTQPARAPESPLKPSTCAPMQSSVIQPISSFLQHSGNTSSPGSHSGATKMPPKYAENMHTKPASSVSLPQSENVLGHVNSMPNQCQSVHSDHPSNSSISLQNNRLTESNIQESTCNQQIGPIIHLSTLEDLDHAQWSVVQAHWEQLEEMEALYRKEGTLLCQQPDMAFEDYVHKLEDIMKRKARCVHSMRAQLQPYLKLSPPSSDNQHKQEEDNHEPIT
ncbi:uncharacterized protein LOC121903263 isoform X1 [Thunnus maccoyii]|uniref:uncharacterized protein LOC121903263 isoform X1 n=1 Tax=Thunnus maccoyii TaxID=8240 RepID=UPI001C4DC3B1|nr:uncharacterized protein LOC121903263 isoform X1 [Thunnus maccoyii]XP_042276052.1 uncharacterized protein LOC121903263 isoform X1 [Thunnus maccoyii]